MGASAYTYELRMQLCPGCGAPIEVPPDGGIVRCRYCSAQIQVSPRRELPAFAPPPRAQLSEPERLSRLYAQESRQLLPPASIASLFGPGGEILSWRQQDAFAAWQTARKRTVEGALDAAEELEFLNLVLGNQFVASQDWTRHRAMLESSFEAFALPRHRTAVASDLCIAACQEHDLAGAERWLALCDPTSDDLFADSSFRLARATLALAKQDFRDALAVLGETASAVPVHDAFDYTFAIHRAHAWERLGERGRAMTELAAELAKGERALVTLPKIAARTGFCPETFPVALARAQREARRNESRLGRILLGLGIAIVVGIPVLALSSDNPDVGLAALIFGGIPALLLILAGMGELRKLRAKRAGAG